MGSLNSSMAKGRERRQCIELLDRHEQEKGEAYPSPRMAERIRHFSDPDSDAIDEFKDAVSMDSFYRVIGTAATGPKKSGQAKTDHSCRQCATHIAVTSTHFLIKNAMRIVLDELDELSF
jgi:hypothetical protein